MSYEQLFAVDSKYRMTGSISSTDYVINNSGVLGNGSLKSIELLAAEIPNTHYVFSSANENNVITFNEGASDLVATITPATYTNSELETEIKTRLDAAGGLTYTVSIDTTTLKMTISATGAFTLKFSEPSSPWYELGFTNADTSSAASHTGSRVVKLSGDDYVFLTFKNIPSRNLNQSSISYLFRISIDKEFDDMIYFGENTHYNQIYHTNNTNFTQTSFRLGLLKPNGKEFTLNGGDWSALFSFKYYF